MDFDEAIRAHATWKMKLQVYLSKPDRSLDASTVGKDNNCPLGIWLYGAGRKYNNLTPYKSLVEDHAAFHKAAADVIDKADRGQSVKAEIALGSASSFASASSAIVRSLLAMKKMV